MNFQALKKTKYDSVDGLVYVKWEELLPSGSPTGFICKASQQGISLHGLLKITSQKELEAFAKFISEAWKEHHALAPKLTKTLSGH